MALPDMVRVRKADVRHIVERAFPEYKGRKFKIGFVEEVTFWDTNWSGGTRNEYVAIHVDGRTGRFVAPAPWENPLEGLTVDLPPTLVVVCHTYFCGKDMGIRIYANPVHAPRLIGG